MAIFAATGTFLSFFHQGSLGGMFGVIYVRPFVERGGFYIWPWTFFLFILSAIAAGPCFTILCTKLTEAISRKKLVPDNAIQLLAKISGGLLALYMLLKIGDTVGWIYGLPQAGQSLDTFFQEGYYGKLMIFFEIGVFGLIPMVLLLTPAIRKNKLWLIIACLMNCTGIVLNRFIVIIGSAAIPVMPFDRLWKYVPTWQEWGIALAMIGYGVLIFSLSYRYLPVFPKEKELNSVSA